MLTPFGCVCHYDKMTLNTSEGANHRLAEHHLQIGNNREPCRIQQRFRIYKVNHCYFVIQKTTPSPPKKKKNKGN